VIPAVGDEEIDSWLNPLWKAVYPAKGEFRRSEPCFRGMTTVLNRPDGPEISVKPGVVTPHSGAHRVVWWDPLALKLGVEANYGFRQEEVLADESPASLATYEQWRTARTEEIAKGGRLAFDIFSPSETTQPPQGSIEEISVAEVARPAGRALGSHFGSLVHAVLRDIDFAATREAIEAQVDLQARIGAVMDEERLAAADAVAAALAHPLLDAARRAARLHREWPMRFRSGERLLEGIIDLAYFDGDTWHIVDYKTDADFTARRRHYETQLRWYVHAAAQLTKRPVRGWLLRI
jgi:ATP-dependent exoDNAse (exonuclease V) beta subunit